MYAYLELTREELDEIINGDGVIINLSVTDERGCEHNLDVELVRK